MASLLTHAYTALVLGKCVTRKPWPWRFGFLLLGSAVLPDADVIAFILRVPYGSMFGHRGMSHSLCFAALWSWLVMVLEFKHVPKGSRAWWKVYALFFAATASHGVLDAMTNGGLGVAFFAPFDSTRYFFPWRPINVSPISVRRFFSELGGEVLKSEFLYVWLPLTVVWVMVVLLRKIGREGRETQA
jgi:inner membrane protein